MKSLVGLTLLIFHFSLSKTYGVTSNSRTASNFSIILKNLLDKDKYDKILRPSFEEKAVEIGIDLIIISLGNFDAVKGTYSLKFYLRHFWTDPRLKFDIDAGDFFSLSSDIVDRVWTPDTYFTNANEAKLHDVSFMNRQIWLWHQGEILLSSRISVKADCYMNLRRFPLDSQRCFLNLQSYGYNDQNVRYKWRNSEHTDNVVLLENSRNNPDFDVISVTPGTTHNFYRTTGNFTGLLVTFELRRKYGFFLLYYYIPSTLLVIVSWVSFWIDKDQAPARVALGVTTALSLSQVISGVQSTLPKVTYAKAIDFYLMVCFLFVFSSLFEYALVSFFGKRDRPRKRFIRSLRQVMEKEEEEIIQSGDADKVFRHISENEQIIERLDNRFASKGTSDSENSVPKIRNRPRALRMQKISAKVCSLDRYCRVLFPVVFTIFSIIYWFVFTS